MITIELVRSDITPDELAKLSETEALLTDPAALTVLIEEQTAKVQLYTAAYTLPADTLNRLTRPLDPVGSL